MIAPGAWLGLLGGGQLGRMFAMAAQSMGYKVLVLDPDPHGPAAQVATRHLCADYADPVALAEMARVCDAVTTEFESVPAAALESLARSRPVRPSAAAVAIAQDRIREKAYLARHGIPVAPYRVIREARDLEHPDARQLYPAILKSSRLGYDGHGQASVADARQAIDAFQRMGAVPCVLEQRVALRTEISVVVARAASGATALYPVAENRHDAGILDTSIVPAAVPEALARHAQALAVAIADALAYVGVLCVEFFVTEDGALLVNEIAPRPHNSGHYSLDACVTSQFEQQVRALVGAPLGDTALRSPAVMVNLLGDLWRHGEPDWARVLRRPGATLHLYGKSEARPRRKMGHFVLLGAERDALVREALALKRAIAPEPARPGQYAELAA